MGFFLAEWHRSAFTDPAITKFVALLESCSAAVATTEFSARLLLVLSVSADDAVYALFTAGSAQEVLRVCTRAGALPQRLTPDVDARILAGAMPYGSGYSASSN